MQTFKQFDQFVISKTFSTIHAAEVPETQRSSAIESAPTVSVCPAFQFNPAILKINWVGNLASLLSGSPPTVVLRLHIVSTPSGMRWTANAQVPGNLYLNHGRDIERLYINIDQSPHIFAALQTPSRGALRSGLDGMQ